MPHFFVMCVLQESRATASSTNSEQTILPPSALFMMFPSVSLSYSSECITGIFLGSLQILRRILGLSCSCKFNPQSLS